MGAAYGTAKSGVGIAAMGVFRPELVMKSIVPVVMAGVFTSLDGRGTPVDAARIFGRMLGF